MLFLIIFLLNAFLNNATLLHCDFETDCVDFTFDSNWGLTDGEHSQGINHDHTLNTSAGHYRYYNPKLSPQSRWAEIRTTNSIPYATDRALCFYMWYYTPLDNFPFNVQIGIGDDGQLSRVYFSTAGQNASTNDWTLINVTLPTEELNIYIRLNVSTQPLTFDDLLVDYCDGSRPIPPKILYACDFESSCVNDFISLSQYAFQWSILNASDAVKIDRNAPNTDFTYRNASGHYALLSNATRGLGYLHAQREIQITSDESYCLNFRYYGTQGPNKYQTYLSIYSLAFNESRLIRQLWPTGDIHEYQYTFNQWTWGVTSLPIGNYSLLFRVLNGDFYSSTFAVDNIAIISCTYPSPHSNPSLLSFSCNFDDSTMCGMINSARPSKTAFNFTLSTGDTIPYKNLGPERDHTTNSTSGGFLYWNRYLPLTSTDYGAVYTSTPVVENFGLCVKFAYYVKSAVVNKNGTTIILYYSGPTSQIWFKSLDDSQGWQIAIAPVYNYYYDKTFTFYVNETQSVPVSVAFDDIQIDQCSTFEPTTTTITTTTTTTSQTTTTTSSITYPTTTTSTSTITRETSISVQTTPSGTYKLSLSGFISTIMCFICINYCKYFY